MTERPDQDDTTAAESYGGYSVDDEDQPQGEGESLTDDRGLREPLDEGYSPPEHWSAGQRFGNTPFEEETGETLDQRLAQEELEPDPYVVAMTEDEDVDDPEVGNRRAGRLVAEDQGRYEDSESDMVAQDIGIDGAGASAEEAAVHLVDDE